MPLDEQLRALQEWYSHTKTKLLSFKTHFKSFASSVIARADAKSLQIGVEEASYEGPLHLEVILPLSRGVLSLPALSSVSFPSTEIQTMQECCPSMSRFPRLETTAPTNSLTVLREPYVPFTSLRNMKRRRWPWEVHHSIAFHSIDPLLYVDDSREERQLEWGISSATDAKVEKVLREAQEQSEEAFKESLSLGTCFVKRLRSSIALNAEVLARQLTQGHITRTPFHVCQPLDRIWSLVHHGDAVYVRETR